MLLATFVFSFEKPSEVIFQPFEALQVITAFFCAFLIPEVSITEESVLNFPARFEGLSPFVLAIRCLLFVFLLKKLQELLSSHWQLSPLSFLHNFRTVFSSILVQLFTKFNRKELYYDKITQIEDYSQANNFQLYISLIFSHTIQKIK